MTCFKIGKGGKILTTDEYIRAVVNREGGVENMSDKQLNNRLFEMYDAILTHPDNYDQMMASIDDDWMKEYVNNISQDKTEVNGMRFMNSAHQIKTKISYRSGKIGVAQTATQVVDIGLTKNSKSPIAELYSNAYVTLDNLNRTHEAVLFDENGNFITNKVEFEKAQANAKPITTIMSTILNAYVDIAKDPYISKANFTTETLPIAALMLRAGIQKEYVVAFMMNPFVKQLSQVMDASGESIYLFEEGCAKMNDFMDEHGLDKDVAFDHEVDNMIPYSLREMEEMIKGTREIDNSVKLNLFATYRALRAAATEFKKTVRVNNHTTEGAGVTFGDVMAKRNLVDDVGNLGKYDAAGLASSLFHSIQLTTGTIPTALENLTGTFNEVFMEVMRLT